MLESRWKDAKEMIFPKVSVFLLATVLANPVYAGYLVTGPVKAEDCYDFGIKVCSTKTVTEIRKDGKRYEVTNYFNSVSEYNSSTQTCFIKTKSRDWGVLSWGINAVTQPDFWGYDKNGKFGKIDADYVYFKCVPR